MSNSMDLSALEDHIKDTLVSSLPKTRFRARFVESVLYPPLFVKDSDSGEWVELDKYEGKLDTVKRARFSICYPLSRACDTELIVVGEMHNSPDYPCWSAPFAGDPAAFFETVSTKLGYTHHWETVACSDSQRIHLYISLDGRSEVGIDPREVDQHFRTVISSHASDNQHGEAFKLLLSTRSTLYSYSSGGKHRNVKCWQDGRSTKIGSVSIAFSFHFGDASGPSTFRKGEWYPSLDAPFAGGIDGFTRVVEVELHTLFPQLSVGWDRDVDTDRGYLYIELSVWQL